MGVPHDSALKSEYLELLLGPKKRKINKILSLSLRKNLAATRKGIHTDIAIELKVSDGLSIISVHISLSKGESGCSYHPSHPPCHSFFAVSMAHALLGYSRRID